MYAVADGHGAMGHLVSQYLAKNVTKQVETEWKSKGDLTQCLPKVFEKLQKGLTDSDINVSCSGSTFVGVWITNDEVICANVGDSRAILARQSTILTKKLTEKAGNSSISPKTTNLLSKLSARESSSKEAECTLLKTKITSLSDHSGCGCPIKVSWMLDRLAGTSHE